MVMIKLWRTPFPPFTSWASCKAEFLYLSLSPYHFWFWLEAVYRLWGTVQELNAIPSCLPWLRFTLCHGLGSSCRTDALQFCLLDFLHKGLYSTLTGSRWLVERGKKKKEKPTPCFCNFFDCLRILVTYWLQLDVQEGRAGSIHETAIPSLTQKQWCSRTCIFFRAWCCSCHGPWASLASSFPFPFSHKFLFLGKAVDCVSDSGSLPCEIPKIAGEPPQGNQNPSNPHHVPVSGCVVGLLPPLVMYRMPCLSLHGGNCHFGDSYVGYFLSLSSLLSWMLLRMDWEMKL